MASGHPDQEGLVQDVLLLAHRKLHQLQAPKAFKSWLYLTTKNVVSQYYRVKTNGYHDSNLPLENEDDDEVNYLSVLGVECDPTAKLHLQEVAAKVEALGELNAQIFWQYYAEGMSEGEIAKHHGMSLSATKARIHRAHKAVLNEL